MKRAGADAAQPAGAACDGIAVAASLQAATAAVAASTDPALLRAALLRWYDACGRALPWRADRDPYRIWVAEVMLQQTRVDVVMPRYQRFVRTFPDLASLARASEQRVLAAWSGLGYYTRARSLHRAARLLRASGAATFPRDADLAAALPGVGRYTLGAVLSIAYQLPYTALDANVVRVLSRLACLPRADARGEPHGALAALLLDRTRPGDWNQALMELGETVCLPRAPRCDACPLMTSCAARARAATHLFPQPRPRRASERVRVVLDVLHDGAGSVVLERGAFRFLPHLWLPPAAIGDHARGSGTSAGAFRHAILHRRLEVEVFATRLSPARLAAAARRRTGGPAERRVFSRASRARIGRSSLMTKALALALAEPAAASIAGPPRTVAGARPRATQRTLG